jgi:hypothetical protein
MSDDTYKINFLCRNCGETGTITIPDGVTIAEVECPKCKCKTLERAAPVPRGSKPFSVNDNFLVDEDEDRDYHGNFNMNTDVLRE